MSTPKANYLKFIQNVSKQKNARFRKNIGKIDGSYVNTPAGKYYGGRYTDIPMYACSEKCIPAVECFGYFHIL
jgi:hypothetical protein